MTETVLRKRSRGVSQKRDGSFRELFKQKLGHEPRTLLLLTIVPLLAAICTLVEGYCQSGSGDTPAKTAIRNALQAIDVPLCLGLLTAAAVVGFVLAYRTEPNRRFLGTATEIYVFVQLVLSGLFAYVLNALCQLFTHGAIGPL